MSTPQNFILYICNGPDDKGYEKIKRPSGWGLFRAASIKAASIHYLDNKDKIRLVVMGNRVIGWTADPENLQTTAELMGRMCLDENLKALLIGSGKTTEENEMLSIYGAHITFDRTELIERINEILERFKDKDALYALKALDNIRLYSADKLFLSGPTLRPGQTAMMIAVPHPRIGEPGMQSDLDKQSKVLVDPWSYDKPMCTSMRVDVQDGKARLIEVPLVRTGVA